MLHCMACNQFETGMDDMMVLHQAICDRMEEEKRDFRMFAARLIFGENLDQALDAARAMTERLKVR